VDGFSPSGCFSVACAVALEMYPSWAMRASTVLRRAMVSEASVNGSNCVGFSTSPASIAASGRVSWAAVTLK
jgi:hypothetical protein